MPVGQARPTQTEPFSRHLSGATAAVSVTHRPPPAQTATSVEDDVRAPSAARQRPAGDTTTSQGDVSTPSAGPQAVVTDESARRAVERAVPHESPTADLAHGDVSDIDASLSDLDAALDPPGDGVDRSIDVTAAVSPDRTTDSESDSAPLSLSVAQPPVSLRNPAAGSPTLESVPAPITTAEGAVDVGSRTPVAYPEAVARSAFDSMTNSPSPQGLQDRMVVGTATAQSQGHQGTSALSSLVDSGSTPPTSIGTATVRPDPGTAKHPLMAVPSSVSSVARQPPGARELPSNSGATADDGIIPGSIDRSSSAVALGDPEAATDLMTTLKATVGRHAIEERLVVGPRLAAFANDGSSAIATGDVEARVFDPPTNMYHAVGSGTLTAAHGPRMDAAATPPLAPHVVNLQMGHVDGSLSENVRWLVDNKLRNVTVNVNPSGMGPVSISVVMESEQMNVSIVANQGSTREALEAALPRLREQLVQQGNDQVNVNVSGGRSGHSGSSAGHADSDAHDAPAERLAHESVVDSAEDPSIRTGRALMYGLVDTYA